MFRCFSDTPPELTTPNRQTTDDIHGGASHSLKCHAKGTPNPTYRWRFNGNDVPQGVTVNDTTGDLTISEFKERHEGNYQCTAENTITGNVVVAMSAVITLRKVRLGSEWPASSNVDVTSAVGDYAKLTCDNPPASVPASQFSWYLVKKNDRVGQIKINDRIYIDAEGTLHFIYVENDDQKDNLRYKCAIHNSDQDLIKLGSEKNLKITNQDKAIQQTKAVMQFYTKSAQFMRNKEATLECVFSGHPIPTITWLDKQKNLISNNKKFSLLANPRKLIIKDLQEEDEGIYTCKGSNFGEGEDGEIFLDVTSGPIWEESPRSQTVPENRKAIFKCRARQAVGDSKLKPPVWLKNGDPLPVKNTEKFQFTDKARVLTVTNLNKTTDIMCFQCNVSNDIGYAFGDGCLNVIEPIVITQRPAFQHISKGELVDLTVVGKTDPAYILQYKWYFNNIIYENPAHPPHVTYNETTMQAHINTSDLSAEEYRSINGTYIRELYHRHDSLNVSVHVLLRELPAPVVDPPLAVASFWWIAVIAAVGILLVVIILIAIVNRKQQKGIYLLDKRERANDLDPEKDIADSGFHALSCAQDEDDYPTKPMLAGVNDVDYVNMGDDDRSLSAYEGEDFDTSKFNEDGSFLGEYSFKNKASEAE